MKQLMSVVKVGNASMLQRKCNLKVSKCKENIQDAKLETGANFPEIPIRSESFMKEVGLSFVISASTAAVVSG